MTMSILELLQHIVNEPAPRLQPEGKFPSMAEEFVDACLLKDPEARPTPKDLLVSVLRVRVKLGPFYSIYPLAEPFLDLGVQDQLNGPGGLGVNHLSLNSRSSHGLLPSCMLSLPAPAFVSFSFLMSGLL